MNRSGFRFQKIALTSVLCMLVLAGTTQAQPAAAQSEEPDDQEKALHYSLYWENFKNGSYEAAMPDLMWVLDNAPVYPRGQDQNFERAVEAYEKLAEAAADDATKRAHLEAGLELFDRALGTLAELEAEYDEFQWTRDKGRYIQTHRDHLGSVQAQAIEAYMRAYELDNTRLGAFYLDQILRTHVQAGDLGSALTFLKELDAQRGEEEDVQKLVDNYFGLIPPDQQVEFLEKSLAEDPDNLELKGQLFDLYKTLGMREKMVSMAEELLAASPSAQLLTLLSEFYLNEGDPERALEMYQQLTQSTDFEPTPEVYYNMGLAHRELGQSRQARTQFRQALNVNSSFGLAYIGIGDLYAEAVSTCAGSKMEREDQAVYWLAVDYYQRARNSDQRIAAQANAKISTYRQYFPDAEALFFKGWEAGQQYRVDYGCYAWIGETTTVKQP